MGNASREWGSGVYGDYEPMTWLSVALVVSACISLFFFPWPLTVLLTLGSGVLVPLVPLALGLLADALYWAPGAGMPFYTLTGALITVLAFFVHARLWARIM